MHHNFVHLDEALTHWATTTPNAEAISMLGITTSYQQLDKMADQLAIQLLLAGVEIGDRIIIASKKSAQSIAAIHAVVRIGAIYVPLDLAAPKARIDKIIASTQPVCIMTDQARFELFEDHAAQARLIDIAEPNASQTPISDALTARRKERSREARAYILMTSGSTGTPKGIVHTHKSGLAYAAMAAQLCALSPIDRVSHHTPLHFDMSIFDIFSTLIAGATIVIMPEMHVKFPASLSKLTQDEAISVLYAVPFALIQMVERGALEQRDFSRLRLVMFAGEKMPPASLYAFAQHAPNAQFYNAYGPTETNHCTTMALTHRDIDGVSPLPIGHPSHGVSAHIDWHDDEETEGELLIASDQVMQGYWNDPQQDQHCFTDMFDAATQSTMRYYRTDDIVTRRADGALMLVGRKDRQIKLRGFRIELDEVELTLANCPGISEAVVMAASDELTAFITGPTALDVTKIQAQAAEILPPYAVPSKIHWLDDMLRTSTGKIDRKGLYEKYYD